jgi:hypothetical protein
VTCPGIRRYLANYPGPQQLKFARDPLQVKLHRADSQDLLDGESDARGTDLRHACIQCAQPDGEIDPGWKGRKLPLPDGIPDVEEPMDQRARQIAELRLDARGEAITFAFMHRQVESKNRVVEILTGIREQG